MDSANRPEILLLSLAFRSFFDEAHSSLIDSLYGSALVKRAKTASGAVKYFEANNPGCILVTDEGLTKTENRAVLDKVVAYVRNGGLVVVGLHFTNFTNMDAFDQFFETLGLPWRRGDYQRSDFRLNPSCSLPTGVASSSLPAPYSMKVLHIKNAQPHEKIFIPVADAMSQSHVFAPEYVDQAQAAVVGARIGNGYLAYVGDVNSEKGSDNIILSLCGL
ncbi:MAG: hypothetical protein M1840_003766 [Geoglossum simile]|nr:MAG: hypothetical protein M1840_003766 [Geoglossum simile]